MATDDSRPEPTPDSRNRARWPVAIATFAAACVVAWLLADVGQQPVFAFWVIVATTGWLLVWWARASRAGAAFWAVAAFFLGVAFGIPPSANTGLVPVAVLPAAFGGLCCVAAGVCFLVGVAGNPSRSAGNCAGAMFALFTVVNAWMAISPMCRYCDAPAAVRETRDLVLTLHRLTMEIEKYRVKLGRLPQDETELVALRGEPMPPYHRDRRIRYVPTVKTKYSCPDGDYHLECYVGDFWGCAWDIFGWGVDFYGPDTAERIQVEFF